MYNRGVAKKVMGDRTGADVDMAGARQINPNVGK
jgi:hypothetical protein